MTKNIKEKMKKLPIGFQVATIRPVEKKLVYNCRKQAWLDPKTNEVKELATHVTDVWKKEWDD